MAKEAKENLGSAENDELKDRALDYLKRYMADGETLRIGREDALKAYRRDPYPEDAAIPTGSRSKFVMSDVSVVSVVSTPVVSSSVASIPIIEPSAA